MKCRGGGDQSVGLVGSLVLFCCWGCLLVMGCQSWRMLNSSGLHCWSAMVQCLLRTVSWIRDLTFAQVTSGGADREWKILLFRSFQSCQSVNPGSRAQMKFKMGLLKDMLSQFSSVLLMQLLFLLDFCMSCAPESHI